MVSYKQGDYDKALDVWNSLKASEISNDTLSYFKGVAFLAKNNTSDAITALKNVDETSSFKNEACYYLGLAYLKDGNIELAKKNLTLSTIDDSKRLLDELAE